MRSLWLRFLTVSLSAGVLGGCSAGPSPSNFTQAQLNAIETREVAADLDHAFSAASGAMFDAGYTISMSDRAAGLITGTQGKDNSTARAWISPTIQDTHFVLSVQVRQISPKVSTVRVKTSINGQPVVKKEAIDAFWTLMQREVLMKDAPAEPDQAKKQ